VTVVGRIGPWSSMPQDRPDDQRVDEAMAALAVARPQRGALSRDVVARMRPVLVSRLGPVLTVLWVLALAAALGAAFSRTTVFVHTALGPARASCGLDVYVYGYPAQAVASACGHAEASRLAVFVPAVVAVLAGLVFAGVVSWRAVRMSGRASVWRDPMRRAPVRAVLVGLGALAAVVVCFALRPVPAELRLSGRALSVSCGADAYFGGYPDSAVRTACGHAYGAQAHVLVDAGAVMVVGVAALVSLWVQSGSSPWRRRQRVLWVAAAAGAAVALVALVPVPVEVHTAAGPALADCGVDAFVAGYPVAALQGACRSAAAGHAEVALAAGVGAAAVLVTAAARAGRRYRASLPFSGDPLTVAAGTK